MSALFFDSGDLQLCRACTKVLSQVKINSTKTAVKQQLTEHPNYPSLLSVSDVLENYGVICVTVKTDISRLRELPLPSIIPFSSNSEEPLTVLLASGTDDVTYFNAKTGKTITESISSFKKKWTSNIALLIEVDRPIHEPDYRRSKTLEIFRSAITAFRVIGLPIAVLSSIVSALFLATAGSATTFAYLFLTALGCILTSFLVLYEIDGSSPIIKRLCGIDDETGCGLILKSDDSRIIGISWSTIGFVYFYGTLTYTLLTPNERESKFFIFSVLSILCVPTIAFSIYYQWQIAKHWCKLCLSIQLLLLIQLILAISARWYLLSEYFFINIFYKLLVIGISFSLPVVLVDLILRIASKFKQLSDARDELKALKYNPTVFKALLRTGDNPTFYPERLGIFLGPRRSPITILKVCNPYCQPCANSHRPLEKLLEERDDVNVQIIFFMSRSDNRVPAPTKHLLSIAQKGDQSATMKALDYWYVGSKQNYADFEGRYKLDNELANFDNEISDMEHWCKEANITYTPTFFLNGFKLPEHYSISDLKFFL